MTDSQEKKASDSQDCRTIRIELHGVDFDSMRRMMSGFCDLETAPSSCCEMRQEACSPQAEDGKNREFTFVIKRKG